MNRAGHGTQFAHSARAHVVCRRENSYGATFSGVGAVRASQSDRLCLLLLRDYFPTEPFLAARQRTNRVTDVTPRCRDKFLG
jgi:hypothetical protein